MLTYPIQIEADGAAVLVTCPDLPEVATDADSRNEAPLRAANAISEALAGRLDDFDSIPRPSHGKLMRAPIAPYIAIKSLLAIRLAEVGKTRAGLAGWLGWHRNSVDRLFQPQHGTKLDQFDAAFRALNARMSIEVQAV